MAARVNRTAPASKAKPTPSAPAPAPGPSPDDEVPEFTTAPADSAEGERVVLFRLDGREWTMRTDRSFGAAMRYLYGIQSGSLQTAQLALLEHCVRPEGVKALLSASELDPLLWDKVLTRAVKHVLGKPEKEEDPGN